MTSAKRGGKRRKLMKSRMLVVALVLGILITNACTPTPGKRINPVEQAGLRDTVKIEVMQWDTWGAEGEPPYAYRTTRRSNLMR